MRSAGLEPKRLRVVHAFSDAKASMVLVEAVKGGRKGGRYLAAVNHVRFRQEL